MLKKLVCLLLITALSFFSFGCATTSSESPESAKIKLINQEFDKKHKTCEEYAQAFSNWYERRFSEIEQAYKNKEISKAEYLNFKGEMEQILLKKLQESCSAPSPLLELLLKNLISER